jgi:hypothetical protein
MCFEHLSTGEWKPIFRNTSTSKQTISIMQIAFANDIFLLDLLHFFGTCDNQSIQIQLARRLFDDDHVTLLCKCNEMIPTIIHISARAQATVLEVTRAC